MSHISYILIILVFTLFSSCTQSEKRDAKGPPSSSVNTNEDSKTTNSPTPTAFVEKCLSTTGDQKGKFSFTTNGFDSGNGSAFALFSKSQTGSSFQLLFTECIVGTSHQWMNIAKVYCEKEGAASNYNLFLLPITSGVNVKGFLIKINQLPIQTTYTLPNPNISLMDLNSYELASDFETGGTITFTPAPDVTKFTHMQEFDATINLGIKSSQKKAAGQGKVFFIKPTDPADGVMPACPSKSLLYEWQSTK